MTSFLKQIEPHFDSFQDVSKYLNMFDNANIITVITVKQYSPNKLTLYPETISNVLIDKVNMT